MFYKMFQTLYLTSPIFHTICFVLLQIILVNVVKSEDTTLHHNVTEGELKWKLGRSKRALFGNMPRVLYIKFKYADEELIDLKLIKVSSGLANQYLPIEWSSQKLDPRVMENIGEFVVFHDLGKCSSVVYFQKLNALFGYIGMNYFISFLPYKFDMYGSYPELVRSPFIIKRTNAPIHNHPLWLNMEKHEDFLPRSDSGPTSGIKRPADPEPGPSGKYQRNNRDVDELTHARMPNGNGSVSNLIRSRRGYPIVQHYHLEILVFVTNGVFEKLKEPFGINDAVAWIIRYCISYFNAVYMTFRKLTFGDYTISINIAKIVIEDNLKPFPFISNGELRFPEGVATLRQYLNSRRDIDTPDSFDHVFIITSLPIKYESIVVPGMTNYNSDLYTAKSNNQFYNAVPVTIVGYETDYAVAVREIGRTLNVRTDTVIAEPYTEQCSDIMQGDSSKCDRCLKWSHDSERQLRVFFKENQNRCFLLNKPRSLRPPGPSKMLSTNLQCKCSGFFSDLKAAKAYVSPTMCNAPLTCPALIDGQLRNVNTIPPLDGTVCRRDMVCWNGECVPFRKGSCNY